MKYLKLSILIAIIGLSGIVLVNSAKAADYYAEGIVLSTDLLSGVSGEGGRRRVAELASGENHRGTAPWLLRVGRRVRRPRA